ncbi:MAG: 50S ribosomal protein L4 [Deltaproteobacteria bacterium]|nr:50S ribosomal protein L4 [Deltaproteobacteria bacterium]
MTPIPIYNLAKEKVGQVELPPSFGEKANVSLLHQVVVAQRKNKRQGNAKVKNRHEVAGSTRKIYRQKGTGGARHGDIKAPLFVGGGQAFGPKPRDYDVRLPQKIRRAALRSAILQRASEGHFWLLEKFDFKEPKTKKAAELLKKFGIPGALVVLEAEMPHVEKSIRNLKTSHVCRIEALNVEDILRYDHLMMTRASYDRFVCQWGEVGGEVGGGGENA